MPLADWLRGWWPRRPVLPLTIKRAVKRAEWLLWPWLAIAVGLYVGFRVPATALSGWPRGSLQALALFDLVAGSLSLGWRLFVGTIPGGFTRPLGQMVVGTLVNGLLTLGITWCGLKIGTSVAPLDARMLGIAAVLLATQGIALPLYAWWRWSGDRNMEKFTQAVINALREDAKPGPRAVQHEKRTDDAEP